MHAVVRPPGELMPDEVQHMIELMQLYYLNVIPDQFRSDLAEKDKVILLYAEGALVGFSTWMLFRHECNGKDVGIIFSGDTITDSDHRSSMALPVAWGGLMLSALEDYPNRPLYWLLTTKGYKTYRFLPVFFRNFYPSYLGPPPDFERTLLESLGQRKFGDRFDPVSFVAEAHNGAQRLRPGVGDVTPAALNDPHVAFFSRANPGYVEGSELLCLASCDLSNISPFMLRQLRR